MSRKWLEGTHPPVLVPQIIRKYFQGYIGVVVLSVTCLITSRRMISEDSPLIPPPSIIMSALIQYLVATELKTYRAIKQKTIGPAETDSL